jgi:hypothetical protein
MLDIWENAWELMNLGVGGQMCELMNLGVDGQMCKLITRELMCLEVDAPSHAH